MSRPPRNVLSESLRTSTSSGNRGDAAHAVSAGDGFGLSAITAPGLERKRPRQTGGDRKGLPRPCQSSFIFRRSGNAEKSSKVSGVGKSPYRLAQSINDISKQRAQRGAGCPLTSSAAWTSSATNSRSVFQATSHHYPFLEPVNYVIEF